MILDPLYSPGWLLTCRKRLLGGIRYTDWPILVIMAKFSLMAYVMAPEHNGVHLVEISKICVIRNYFLGCQAVV